MLLRLVAYGLVSYAAYELYKCATSPSSPAARADQSRQRIGRRPTRAVPTGELLASSPMPTGGMEVTAGDPDGGMRHLRVGRGVIPQA